MYQLKIYITALIKLKFVFTSFKLDFNHPLLNLQLKKKSTIFLKWNCKINFKKASTKRSSAPPTGEQKSSNGSCDWSDSCQHVTAGLDPNLFFRCWWLERRSVHVFHPAEKHFHQQTAAFNGEKRSWGGCSQKKRKINVQVLLDKWEQNEKRRNGPFVLTRKQITIESNWTSRVPSVRFHGDVGGGAQLCVLIFAGGDVVGGLGGGGGARVGGGQSGFSDLVLSLVEQDVGRVGLNDTRRQTINKPGLF